MEYFDSSRNRVEDRLANYLLAGELFTKINHKTIDLHYKFNRFSVNNS